MPRIARPTWLKSSAVKKLVYHATNAVDFTSFDVSKGDLGAHFGTLDQANYIAEHRRGGAGARIIPAWLYIRRPLRLKDVGTFHADGIARQLERKGIIPRGEGKRIEKECDADWRKRKVYDAQLRDAIVAAGYDGVVYKNGHEGTGDSYIVFHPGQVKSAMGNKGTFDRESAVMTNPQLSYDEIGGESFVRAWLDTGAATLRVARFEGVKPIPVEGYKLWVTSRQNGRVVEWALTKRGVVGAGAWGIATDGTPQEYGVAIDARHRGKGLHRKIVTSFRNVVFKRPVESDVDRSHANHRSWERLGAVPSGSRLRLNPHGVFNVRLASLLTPDRKLQETLGDISAGKLSRTKGPLTVTKAGHGRYLVVNGNHRALEGLMAGMTEYPAELDQHVPDLTRAGGGYDSVLRSAVPLSKGIARA